MFPSYVRILSNQFCRKSYIKLILSIIEVLSTQQQLILYQSVSLLHTLYCARSSMMQYFNLLQLYFIKVLNSAERTFLLCRIIHHPILIQLFHLAETTIASKGMKEVNSNLPRSNTEELYVV